MSPDDRIDFKDILYGGIPVSNWLAKRVMLFIASNAIVRGTHDLGFRFARPIAFELPFGTVFAKSVRIQFKLSGGWFAQPVEIDATCGLYDWMRRTIRLGPGAGRTVYKGVQFGKGGTPISCPPDFDRAKPWEGVEGEVSIWILDLGGIDIPQDIPDIDSCVIAEDLELFRRDLPHEAYYSVADAGSNRSPDGAPA